jgi:uncharacterized protein YbjT (DUF2867 family)
MTPPILVTGASGKVGGAIVKGLLGAGAPVRAASHHPDKHADERHDPVDWVEVEFNRRDTLAPAFRGVEKAVLITPEDVAMVCQTAELLDAAREAGVSHVVRVSFLNVGDDGIGGPLLAWHREAEKLVEQSGMAYTILRPNSYMQNFVTTYAPSIHLKDAFFTPMGEGRISYVDALDVGDVAVEVLLGGGHEGKAYSLTGPQSLGHDEIARVLTREVGRPIRYVDVGEDEACSALHRRGVSPELTGVLCELWLEMRRDKFAPLAEGVEVVTGRKPRTFEQFARDHRAEFSLSPLIKSGSAR